MALVALALPLFAGCAGDGGDARLANTAFSQTMGQELRDLKAAYDDGLISEREYERARKDILDRYDD